jgi:hypothetical protein
VEILMNVRTQQAGLRVLEVPKFEAEPTRGAGHIPPRQTDSVCSGRWLGSISTHHSAPAGAPVLVGQGTELA